MSTAVDNALKTRLEAITNIATLAPGGVHNIVRKQGSAFPVIVFSLVGGPGDQPRYGAVDGQELLDYDVKVIAPLDQQAGVGAIVDLVHAALQGVQLPTVGVYCQPIMRLRRIPNYPDASSGVTYLHRGGTYRIEVSHPAA